MPGGRDLPYLQKLGSAFCYYFFPKDIITFHKALSLKRDLIINIFVQI